MIRHLPLAAHFVISLCVFAYVEWQIGCIYDILDKAIPTIEEPSPVHTRAAR